MADQRILYTERMVGAGHSSLSDTLNRLSLVEHNNDGTHKYQVIVHAGKYGFVGDYGTDDTSAINSAISAAAALVGTDTWAGLAKVYIPFGASGKSKITSQIVIPRNVVLDSDATFYNNLASNTTPAFWFKSGSHCKKLAMICNSKSGVQFGVNGELAQMDIGKVIVGSVGTASGVIGVLFTGHNFAVDDIETNGGNYGVSFNAVSDVRINTLITVNPVTGLAFSAAEHININFADIDSYTYCGMQIDSSHDVRAKASVWVNGSGYPSAFPTYGALIGEYSSGDLVRNLSLDLAVQGGCSTALRVSNTKDSNILANITNATLYTAFNQSIATAISYGTGNAGNLNIFGSVDSSIATQVSGTLYGRLNVFPAMAAAPTTGTWAVGCFVPNSSPSELGAIGSKYIIQGWVCTVAGTPGTWLSMRTLTGN